MILLTLFGVVVAVNIFFYFLFSRFCFSKQEESNTYANYPVSLIVCAKNEAENLKENVPLLLSQDYEHFELILVNDNSSDDTLEVMQEFENQSDKIVVVDVKANEAFWGSKKYALTLGIKKAKHQRLLFTDADCRPAGKNWIAQMTGSLDEEKQIVLGYGSYSDAGGLLSKLIRYETVITAMQYLSMALRGLPYMGVGRNMAYTSNLFYENKGFVEHMDVRSGDDDLFINKAASRDNVCIQVNSSAFTVSKPKTRWKDWMRQKRRHYTTSKHYKFIHKVILSMFYLTSLLFWMLAAVSWYPSSWIIWGALIVIRLAVVWLIVGRTAAKLKEKGLIPLIPILEVFLILIQLSIFISGRKSRELHWK